MAQALSNPSLPSPWKTSGLSWASKCFWETHVVETVHLNTSLGIVVGHVQRTLWWHELQWWNSQYIHIHVFIYIYTYICIHVTTTTATITTLHDTTTQLQLQLPLHYTTTQLPLQLQLQLPELQLQLQLHYNYTTLHHTTSTSCVWGDHFNHSKKHNSNHLPVHQWIRSAIHPSQQLTSPIVSYLWNFRHRLVQYYWCIYIYITYIYVYIHTYLYNLVVYPYTYRDHHHLGGGGTSRHWAIHIYIYIYICVLFTIMLPVRYSN